METIDRECDRAFATSRFTSKPKYFPFADIEADGFYRIEITIIGDVIDA